MTAHQLSFTVAVGTGRVCTSTFAWQMGLKNRATNAAYNYPPGVERSAWDLADRQRSPMTAMQAHLTDPQGCSECCRALPSPAPMPHRHILGMHTSHK
jgi:hypothetical protein